MAERVPGAKFVELAGNDHIPWVGDQEAILREVEEFTGSAPRGLELNAILATVLIVRITRPASERAEIQSTVRRLTASFRGREIAWGESSYAAAFDGPARAIRAAAAIESRLRKKGLEASAGLHTGECEVSGSTMSGLAIDVASQIAEKAAAGEILASRTVKDLVAGSGIRFNDRGTFVLRHFEGAMQLFAVETGVPE
jgi:hypothetical protein